MTETLVETSVTSLVGRVATDLQSLILHNLETQDRFTWALSGGHTPRQLYETLAREPYRSAIPWAKVWIFWGDERAVPPTDSESNFRMAQEALLKNVPISAQYIFRMKGELPAAEAARDYNDQLRAVFGSNQAFPTFDLILLGLGPDGHTASLFPGTHALEVIDRWVTDNPVETLKTTRITLTLPALNNARNVWFLATGAEKAAVYATVRSGRDIRFPASLIAPQKGVLRWYVDHAMQ